MGNTFEQTMSEHWDEAVAWAEGIATTADGEYLGPLSERDKKLLASGYVAGIQAIAS